MCFLLVLYTFLVSADLVWCLWLKPCFDCVVADPDNKWDQVLKLLYDNVPEEFYVWMSNMKQVLQPLVDRVQDLLQALP